MIVRITVGNVEFWRHDVLKAVSEGQYMELRLSEHPHVLYQPLDAGARVEFFASQAEVIATLGEESNARFRELDEIFARGVQRFFAS